MTILLVLLCFFEFTTGNVIRSSCTESCEQQTASIIRESKSILFGIQQPEMLIRTCTEGCKYFSTLEPHDLINALIDCENYCRELIPVTDLMKKTCKIGCRITIQSHTPDVHRSINNINMEDSTDFNALQALSDMPEMEILSDPGLQKELDPKWWQQGFKLPQTFFKTVPQDSKVVDYGVLPDYISEVEKSPKSWQNNASWKFDWKNYFTVKFSVMLIIIIFFILRASCKTKCKEKELEHAKNHN